MKKLLNWFWAWMYKLSSAKSEDFLEKYYREEYGDEP